MCKYWRDSERKNDDVSDDVNQERFIKEVKGRDLFVQYYVKSWGYGCDQDNQGHCYEINTLVGRVKQ